MTSPTNVWAIPLAASERYYADAMALLNEAERARAVKFHHCSDKLRWVVGRACIKQVLASHLHVSPAQLRFSLATNGKPELSSQVASPDFRFSLSHSGDWAIVGLTTGAEIGVDIERVRDFDDMNAVAQRVFSGNELLSLETTTGREFLTAFFLAWTRKEALIKATGEGLGANLQSIEVDQNADAGPRVIRYDKRSTIDWQLVDIDVAPSYCAAIATERAEPFNIELKYFPVDRILQS